MKSGQLSALALCLLVILSTTLVSARQPTIETIRGREITVSGLENFISFQMDSLGIPGLSIAIINNNSVVYAKNLGVKNQYTGDPVNSYTVFEACSLSKPLFAYFVLKLILRGVLDIDKPLYTYFMDKEVDYSDSGYKLLTVRMVLNHCSGWPNWRSDSNGLLEFSFIPGTKSGYSGEGYQYLKRVMGYLMNVSDRKLNEYFQQEIADPLDTEVMSFFWQDSLSNTKAYGHRNGIPTDNGPQGKPEIFDAAGGLHTTAEAYAKFIVDLMGKNNEISSDLLRLQTSLPPEQDGLYRSLGFPYKLIGGKMRFYHSGNNGDTRSYCHFYKEEGLGLVLFGNCDNFFSSGFTKKLLAFLDEEYPY